MHESSSERTDTETKRYSWDIPSGTDNLAKNIRWNLEIISELIDVHDQRLCSYFEDNVADIKDTKNGVVVVACKLEVFL